MTAAYAALLGLGIVIVIVSFLWARRTRHERKLWRASRRADTVAIVLELEECVRELDEAQTTGHTEAVFDLR